VAWVYLYRTEQLKYILYAKYEPGVDRVGGRLVENISTHSDAPEFFNAVSRLPNWLNKKRIWTEAAVVDAKLKGCDVAKL